MFADLWPPFEAPRRPPEIRHGVHEDRRIAPTDRLVKAFRLQADGERIRCPPELELQRRNAWPVSGHEPASCMGRPLGGSWVPQGSPLGSWVGGRVRHGSVVRDPC